MVGHKALLALLKFDLMRDSIFFTINASAMLNELHFVLGSRTKIDYFYNRYKSLACLKFK
jgi:hypothetical protein